MAKSYGLNATGEQASVKRADMPRFLPEDLIPNSNNYRFGSFDDDPEIRAAREAEIEEMVAQLCAEGQKQPIVVHQVSGNRFQVHAGDTRHQAFLRINQRRIWPWSLPDDEPGRARIMAIVEATDKNEDAFYFSTSIVENIGRNSLSIVDVAIAVARATGKYGMSDHDILRKFNQLKSDGKTPKDPAWLPNMRRIACLPVERKRQIHLGALAASVGYLLAELPEERHQELLDDAAAIQSGEAAPASIMDDLKAIDNILSEPEQGEPPVDSVAPALMQPIPQPRARKKASKPVTARALAKAAKAKGLLKHKKVGKTVADCREFWGPIANDRAPSLLKRLAEANIAWLDGQSNDDKFYKEVLAVLKGASANV